MCSTSTFRPTALLATRGTTASFQRCSDTGRARAGGRVRTFRCAARVRAALRSSAGKVSVATVLAASCRTQCLKGRASARERVPLTEEKPVTSLLPRLRDPPLPSPQDAGSTRLTRVDPREAAAVECLEPIGSLAGPIWQVPIGENSGPGGPALTWKKQA